MNHQRLYNELHRFDPRIVIEEAWTPPSSWYTDPELCELERSSVFATTWQPAARLNELTTPGAYATGCLAGQPWVVIRNQSGKLAAFHNVCRHKGREVVTGCGVAKELVCGYHAWRYDLDGTLRKAPRLAGIKNFDRKQMSLAPLHVQEWGPWAFINLDLDAPPLQTVYTGLTETLERTEWNKLSFVARRTWTLACNWKVYVDNYLDGGYHVPHMHPSLEAQLDFSSYRTLVFDHHSIQTSQANNDASGNPRIGDGAVYAWMFPTSWSTAMARA